MEIFVVVFASVNENLLPDRSGTVLNRMAQEYAYDALATA